MTDKSRVLPIFLTVLVAGEFAAFCIYYAKATQTVLFIDLMLPQNVHIEQAMNVLFMAADLALAISMVVLLRKRRSGFPKTDSIVKRIVLYTVGTSVATVFISTVALVSVLVAPQSFLFLAADLTICKCK